MTIDNAHIKATVIKKRDKDFPDWLDFTALRNEGLRHIGALSGKLWTDHNLHDPGITTLEVLCYALLDLGYRASLPIENLLAPTTTDADDNFFTPNQILTNNPLTITDYRKLLLSLPEIRNAWLTVSEDSKLSIVGSNEKLIINGLYNIIIEPNFDWVKEKPTDKSDTKIDPSVIRPKISHADLSKKVNKLLNAHRNLCEDFEPFNYEIPVKGSELPLKGSRLLSADPLVVKGKVLLQTNADAARVYADIHRAVAEFIAPSPRFYALQELLAKGKTIENIYEGRPSMSVQLPTLQAILDKNGGQTLDNDFISEALGTNSGFFDLNLGFIDTDELATIEPRTEIHISDLYNLVSQVAGVQSVQLLQLEKRETGQVVTTKNWCYSVPKGTVVVLENLELELNKGVTTEFRTVNDLSDSDRNRDNQRNGTLAAEPLPYGAVLTDLGDYYSIQRDYPRVYRIGEGGLSANAKMEEVAQVRQFKGYLLFFERILTDYLAQLTNIRAIFSLKPDAQRSAEQTHTYFTGSLDNVPDGDVLLRFARSKDGETALTTALAVTTEGSVLKNIFDGLVKTYSEKPLNQRLSKIKDILLEVDFLQVFAENAPKNPANPAKGLQPQSFTSALQRDAVVDLLQRNLENNHFNTDVYEDAYGFFFTILPTIGGTIVLSRVHYATAKEAREAANLTALVGSFSTGFRLINRPKTTNFDAFYAFDLVSSPTENLDLLSQSLENPTLYANRRNVLLDHLLARFAEQFSDYATLMYGVFKDKIEDKAQTATDKARFLANYDTSSQNRARAFDYTEGGWLSDNVSGFETRLKALAGIQDGRRRTLCPFVIDPCTDEFHVKITDASENILFETTDVYPKEVAEALVAYFTEGGQILDNFKVFQATSDTYGFGFQTPVATLTHPIAYASKWVCEEKIAEIYAFFRQKIAENEVFVSKTKWQLELHDAKTVSDLSFETAVAWFKTDETNVQKAAVQMTEQPFATAAEALNHLPNFTENLKKQGLSLLADPQQTAVFVNTAAFEVATPTLPTVYRWHIFDTGNKLESGVNETPDEATALTDFIAAKTVEGVTICQNIRVFAVEKGYKWAIMDNNAPLFNSLAVFSDREKALSEAVDALLLVTDAKRYFKSGDAFNANFTFLLRDASLRFVAQYPLVFETEKERDKVVRNVQKVLKNTENPLKIQAEPPRYVWILPNVTPNEENTEATSENTEGVPTLKSFSYFDTADNARAHFDMSLHLIGKIEHYARHSLTTSDSQTMTYTFDILNDGTTVATSVKTFETPEMVEKTVQALVQQAADSRFFVQTQEYPDRYRFQYFQLPTDETPLFVSEKDFESDEKATDGFEQFTKELHTNILINKELRGQDGTTIVRVSGDIKQAAAFLKNVKKLRDTKGLTASAIHKSERSEQGTHVYRLLNKDAPLALAMVNNTMYQTQNEAEAAKMLDDFCKKTSRACPVLSLCLDGDNVICIGNQWHYVLKTNHLEQANAALQPLPDEVLFVSWTGYDTKAEAHAAFTQNYVGDITVAADSKNYNVANGVFYERTTPIVAEKGADTEGSSDVPKDTNRRIKYRVFVPKETANSYLKEKLVDFARAYPLREEAKTVLDGAKNPKKQFSFVLYDCEKGVLNWKSAVLFDTPDAGLAAWRQFYAALNAAGACRLSRNDCTYNIGVFEILLESIRRFPLGEAWQNVAKLTKSATQTDALKVLETTNWLDRWSFLGIDTLKNDQILAKHPFSYTTLLETEAALKRADACLNTEGVHFIEKILLRPRSTAERDKCAPRLVDKTCCLPYLDEKKEPPPTGLKPDCDECDPPTDKSVGMSSAVIVGNTIEETDCYLPEADPYSFIIKVIMPSWGRRFGNANFVKELTRLFAHEVPAHIWLDIAAYGPQQLCDFETKYRRWLCDFGTNRADNNLLGDCLPPRNPQLAVSDVPTVATADEDPSVSAAISTTLSVAAASERAVSAKSKGKRGGKAAKTVISTEKTVGKDVVTDVSTEEITEKDAATGVLSEKTAAQTMDNDRFMRRRFLQYSDNIRAVADAKLLKTESYKQTAFFLQNDGNLKALTLLVDLITTKSLNKKGGATDAQYITLLQNALGYALDKLVVASPNAVQHAEILRGIAEKMAAQNMGMQQVMNDWQGEALAERLGATVVLAYRTILSNQKKD